MILTALCKINSPFVNSAHVDGSLIPCNCDDELWTLVCQLIFHCIVICLAKKSVSSYSYFQNGGEKSPVFSGTHLDKLEGQGWGVDLFHLDP